MKTKRGNKERKRLSKKKQNSIRLPVLFHCRMPQCIK